MTTAVSNVSKVINLKAIHNLTWQWALVIIAVSNVSKVINLKAIHNAFALCLMSFLAVSNVSKVINLKAIHNSTYSHIFLIWLFPMCQR